MARIKPQALLIQSKKKKGPARISLRSIITVVLLIIAVSFSLYASYKYWKRGSIGEHEINVQGIEEFQTLGGTVKHNLPSYAFLRTSKGLITVELYKDGPSDVLEKFVKLCKKGFFNGTVFYVVIKNYVILGGNFRASGTIDEWVAKGKSHNQIKASPKHEAFMLGTSKAKYDDKSFDIFITTTPVSDLSENLIVFGRVVKGEDVVQEIEEVDTDEHYRPKSTIGIKDISLKQEI